MDNTQLQNLVERLKSAIATLGTINLDELITKLHNIEGFDWLNYLKTYLANAEELIDEINSSITDIESEVKKAAMDLNNNAVS